MISTSGCITFHFLSDLTTINPGWIATISCQACASGCSQLCNGGAPPSNDDCSGALYLGTLPVPQPCPNGIGNIFTNATSNLCATAELPYTSLVGC